MDQIFIARSVVHWVWRELYLIKYSSIFYRWVEGLSCYSCYRPQNWGSPLMVWLCIWYLFCCDCFYAQIYYFFHHQYKWVIVLESILHSLCSFYSFYSRLLCFTFFIFFFPSSLNLNFFPYPAHYLWAILSLSIFFLFWWLVLDVFQLNF